MTTPERSPLDEYAYAIGSAILSLNGVEAELHALAEALAVGDALPKNFEANMFSRKLRRILGLAQKQTDPALRAQMARLILKAYRLSRDRNNFAHALLWHNPFNGQHQRRF